MIPPYTVIVDRAVPPREVWIEGRDLRVEVADGMIKLVAVGERPIQIVVHEAETSLPFHVVPV